MSIKLREYEFEEQQWPPPKEEAQRGAYLFGFDDDYVPYVLRYESYPGLKGWNGVTLEDGNNSGASAFPKYLDHKDVERRIKWWAKAPVLKHIARRYA